MRRRQRMLLLQTLAAIALVAIVLVYAWSYVAPLLFAAFLAAVIDPYVNRLHGATGLGRGTAVIIVLSAVLVLLLGAFALVIINLVVELERLLAHLPDYTDAVGSIIDGIIAVAEQVFARLPHPLDDMWQFDADQAAQATGSVVKNALGGLTGAPGVMFFIIVAALMTYFVSRDRHLLWGAVLKVLPSEWRRPVVRVRDEIVGGVLGMVRAQLILVTLTATMSVIGLALVGVPYAWGLGMLAGMFDLAPMIGPGGVFVPIAVIYAFSDEATTAIAVVVLWLALVFVRQFIEPHIFSVQLGLHPVTILAAVYIGVQAVGLVGFIIGPLALIVVKALFVVAVLPETPRPTRPR